MSKLGEQIRTKAPKARVRVEVPEWGDDEPLVIFAGELLVGEFSKIQRKHPDFLNNQTIEALVDLIIMKAETDQGDKAFDLDDKPILMRQPLNTVADVATRIMGGMNTVEDAEKN
jgi:hypothetical protein